MKQLFIFAVLAIVVGCSSKKQQLADEFNNLKLTADSLKNVSDVQRIRLEKFNHDREWTKADSMYKEATLTMEQRTIVADKLNAKSIEVIRNMHNNN